MREKRHVGSIADQVVAHAACGFRGGGCRWWVVCVGCVCVTYGVHQEQADARSKGGAAAAAAPSGAAGIVEGSAQQCAALREELDVHLEVPSEPALAC